MRSFITGALCLLVAACSQAPQIPALKPVDFSHKTPIRLAVSEIRVVENYQSPLRDPNVEHTFPTPPVQAVKTWANQRLRAAGGTGVLEVVIDDASVVEKKLPKTDGVRGMFTDDQSERYDARLRVTLRLYAGERAISDAEGNVNVIRSRSINEKATIAQREELQQQIVLEMMQQFDTEAELRFRQYFAPYLR